MDRLILRFAVDAPRLDRHRVSVWDDNGGLLCPPSADAPVDLQVARGETIWVEASVPGTPTSRRRPGRDERRWELRADPDARAVLNLGHVGKNGSPGTRIEITVDGARAHRSSKRPS